MYLDEEITIKDLEEALNAVILHQRNQFDIHYDELRDMIILYYIEKRQSMNTIEIRYKFMGTEHTYIHKL